MLWFLTNISQKSGHFQDGQRYVTWANTLLGLVTLGSKSHSLCSMLQSFSIDCRKTKSKLITTVNQKKENTFKANEISNRPNCLKRGKTRATKSWLVLVYHVIAWENDASFLDQSQSEVKQKQCSARLHSTLIRKLLDPNVQNCSVLTLHLFL